MQIELSNNWFALLLVNESLDEELFDTSFEAKQQLSKKGSIAHYDIIWLEVSRVLFLWSFGNYVLINT